MVYPLDVKEPDSPEIPCTMRKTKYSGSTPICVYKATVDTVVSKAILINGAWEPHLTELMEELFRRDPNLNLFDFGSNVGSFAITALKSGRKVVAVDPKAGNLRRIRMSIHKGHLTGAVLVQNGLSDFRTTATFHQDPGNNGGSYLTDTKLNNTHGIIAKVKFQVKTILVTDLIPVIRFKRAMIKIDIQGFELKAFQHLESFLKTVDIPFILMEWIWVKVGETGNRMVALMYKLGYQCFIPSINGAACPGNEHTKWPYDVVWVRTNATVYPGAYEAIRIWNGKPKPS
ncbi:uncharacterized protein LOC141910387 [Tubulanus polymorphus]|uniref:uncharacterized protein LOC141910387 n=1 Tax=Tubulanus polymorphus TaxID=672921 RepID=UPI003DA672A7